MPYVYDPNLEDDENEVASGAEVQISGASPTTDSEGSDPNTSAPKKEGISTGSGFQNLDSYLNTNQSKEFGQQLLGKVGQEVETAKQNQTDAAEKFKKQAYDSSQTPTSEQVNSAIANPKTADKKQFQGWQSQSYQGPKSLAESADTWNQYWSGTNKANTQTKLLGSEAGRFSLLDSYFGKPNYSFGEKSLDNLLVQQSGLGKQTRDLQNQAAMLKSQGQEGAKDLQGYASERAGAVEQSRNDVLKAIGLDAAGNVLTGEQAGAIGQQYKKVEDALAAANAERHEALERVKSNAAKAKFTGDELSMLGLSDGEKIYNLNLGNYLTPGADLNKNQTMTPEERSYIQALSELAGITDTYASGSPETISNPYSFDANRMRQDVQATQAAYNRAVEDANRVNLDYRDRGGQLVTMSLKEAQEGVDAILRDRARGIDAYPNSNREFMNRAVPAIAAAQAKLTQLQKDYQIDRTIGGAPLLNRPRIGGGIFPRR